MKTTNANVAAAQAALPTLQATAAMLLPGIRHARSVLDVCINVLDYFERQAPQEAATGKLSAPPSVEPGLVEQAQQVRALLTAFGRLHEQKH